MSDAQVPPRPTASIFDGYAPDPSFYDEVFSASGVVRTGLNKFLAAIGEVGQPELARRWRQSQKEIQETGITFNLYDESEGNLRPWELDLLPQLISDVEWSALAAGLTQRARLLNRILADLYGPQESLTSGLIPAEWLFSHPGFRRVFHGQTPANGTFLHFYAADLARAPDGRWWVVGDRTDAPLGLGYALENRIVTSRMLPNAISDFHIERLAPFFMTLQETLRELAPTHRDNPRIVLLSHGPTSPNYFEDAYLSRYLGYTLVEGGDLAVRDDRVFLKTLAGPLPVDVIMRRMSDALCDPLELRGEAGFGVPGLLQAARLGHVAVANALGSSLVESPSLIPFLPRIARKWLGEELLLPSVATWWCGQDGARRQVKTQIAQRQFGRLSFRSAYRVGRIENIPFTMLEGQPESELADLLETEPRNLVVQEAVQRSTSPVWSDEEHARWHVGLRVYLVAADDTYHAMPGGLLRLARESASLDATVLSGRLSKDAWVQASGPVRHTSLLAKAGSQVVLRRSGAELPSRVADHLFWFGRHIERAQGACRLLRSIVSRLIGEGETEGSGEVDYFIYCLAAQGQIEPGFAVEGMKEHLPPITKILPGAVLDEHQTGSLRSSVAHAHRNASRVRDRLSLDSWRIVHHIELTLAQTAEAATSQPFGLVDLDELLDGLIVDMAALDGLIAESMTRTPAWRFLDLGRRLERSLQVASLVQSAGAADSPDDARICNAALEVADSLMTYRSRYLAAVNQAAALDLLLTDDTNPRALSYQLGAIADHVAHLPRDESKPLETPEGRIATTLLHGVRMLEVDDLTAGSGERTKLGRYLQQVTDQLPKLSDLISQHYLVHADVPRQMSDGRSGLR